MQLYSYYQKLDCTIEWSNPADFVYGILENGSYTGFFHDTVEGLIDFTISHNIVTYDRNQVTGRN